MQPNSPAQTSCDSSFEIVLLGIAVPFAPARCCSCRCSASAGRMISASEGVCSICVFHYMCGQLQSSRLMVGFSADFYIAAIYTCIVQLDMAAMPP